MSQGARSMRWWNVVGIVGVAMLMVAGVASAANEWTVAYTSAEKTPLMAIWGSSADDVWAVGQGGTVIHYDGSKWSAVDVGTDKTLRGVWGSGPKDVYVVGEAGTILHYDGTAWAKVESGVTSNLNAIWGSGAEDVYVVGGTEPEPESYNGLVLHGDGTEWSPMDIPSYGPLYNVWGTDANNVYVVNAGSSIFRWDGDTWEHESAFIFSGNSIWGSAGNDIYTVGAYYMFHYDGLVWRMMVSPAAAVFQTIWGSGAEDIFIGGAEGDEGVIFHHDRDSWAKMTSDSTQKISAIWGSGADDVYAVGESGEVLHCNGFVPREVKEYAVQVYERGIEHGPATSGLYPAGSEVTVDADDEYYDSYLTEMHWYGLKVGRWVMGFERWSGSSTSEHNPLTVTVTENMVFVPQYKEEHRLFDPLCSSIGIVVVMCCLLGSFALAGRE